MELIALTFNSANLHDKKVSRLINYIIDQMSDEQNENEPRKILDLSGNLLKMGNKAFPESHILYLLVENNQVLSTALASAYSQISFRWTPPKHRRKGYATKILQMIEEKWKVTKETCLWVCSYPYMANINKRAGWVNDGVPNRDETQDWCPAWCLDRYIKKRDAMNEDGTDFIDDLKALLKQGASVTVATDQEQSDMDVYMAQFPQLQQRKRAQSVRV